jgi:EpsD family peptidyl-prolyl cis-trans isomerase
MGVALAVAVAVACGRKAGDAPREADKSAPLARVGGQTITQKDVDDAMQQIPQSRAREFEGARGKLRIIELLVDRQLMLKAATDAGLDREPEFVRQTRQFRDGLLLQGYQRRMIEALPKPTDVQLRQYYDDHAAEFTTPARINASWIKVATKAAADRARHRIVERGENFADVAREVSIDTETRADGGLLGYFNPTGYVRSIGADKPEFTARVFELEPDDVSEVFAWDGGFAFVKVHEKTSERQEPFERAVDRIRARLTPSFNDSLLQANLSDLRSKYKPQILFDAEKELEGKTAEELMKLATEAGDARDKIEYYRGLLKKYPNFARADEAQFMIGFAYSEELQDFDAARREYQAVIDNYPQSEMRESAQFMLQNMGRGSTLPDFEPPASGTP